MTNRQYFLLGLTAALFGIAFLFGFSARQSDNASLYLPVIEEDLHRREGIVQQILADRDYIFRQVGSVHNETKEDFERLYQYYGQAFTISVFKNDSLAFWTNNTAIPNPRELKAIEQDAQPIFIRHPNGFYAIHLARYDSPQGDITVAGLIPIKYKYGLESEQLINRFAADPTIPTEIGISSTVSGFPIHAKNGQVLCYLEADIPYIDLTKHKISLILFIFSFLSLFILINSISVGIAHHRKTWMGAAFLMLSIFVLRGISMYFDFTGYYSQFSIFSRTYDTPIFSDSLGDLLINVMLLLWIIFYFQKEFSFSSFAHLNRRTKFFLTSMNSFAIILALIMVAGVFKNLVLKSGIVFDFDNVFQMGRSSIMALSGVVFILMALFLFSHRMAQTNNEIGLTKYHRILALGVATLLSVPVLVLSDLMFPYAQSILFAFIFVLIFDIFIDYRAANLTWLMVWLVIFAAFSSLLSFKYSNEKDYSIRLENVKRLAELRDTLAEEKLSLFELQLKRDSFINNIPQPIPFLISPQQIREPIDQKFAEHSYLFNNYSYRLYAFNKYQEAAIEEQTLPQGVLLQKIRAAERTATPGLYFYLDDKGHSVYLLSTEIPNHSSPDNPLSIYFEFSQKDPFQSKVYTELLKIKNFKNLKNVDKYEYAIYKNAFQIGKKNETFPLIYGSLSGSVPERGQSLVLHQKGRSDLIYRSQEDIIVVISRPLSGVIKPVSLFSFLFLLLIAATFILAAINTYIKAIPDILDFSVLWNPSFRNRIQMYMISLILISFVIIGALTIIFFRNEFDNYHEGRLGRKTKTILEDTQREIEQLLAESGFEIDAEGISKIHRMDINVYALDGRLQNSSEYDFFNKGIVSPVMNPVAFHRLSELGENEVKVNENIGEIHYIAAYVPLVNPEGRRIAFLGLPYYSEQGKLRSEVTDFMGFIINAFAFLLLIAGGFAVYIANSITKPLDQIGTKLKQFQLGGKNELLQWKRTNDEIGTLIEEYNRMIKKLEDSAELLAQSERDAAWREMAKQVAHEIKNPLTPMKLSIQYLQHAYQSNPTDIEPLLKRVSGTLIEQIDNLAQIATEFSSFAKMPRAKNSRFVINQLVSNVHDLFSKGETKAELSLSLPDRDLFVFADKNQLMRVLNNLIKNAVQAIPDGRKGRIRIRLYREEGHAIIQVSDNGSGIPQDMLEKVFVPNFTTKSSGTGIGLAISKNIIESINGQIYFKTDLEKGTDFFVKLPIESVQELQEA